jgi:hypothetical protein
LPLRSAPPAPPLYLGRWLTATALTVFLAGEALQSLVVQDRAHRREQVTFPHAMATLDTNLGDGELTVDYYHPQVRQLISSRLTSEPDDLVRSAPGTSIDVVYDPDDPYHLHRAGSPPRPDSGSRPALVMLALSPFLLFVLRLWSNRQFVALAASDAPTLRMFAARIRLRRRWLWTGDEITTRRRMRLALYPLDAPENARPACVIRVHSAVPVPLAGAFLVDVKGSPRPGGRVVLRFGEAVLWPRSRALLTASWRRPAFVDNPISMTVPHTPSGLVTTLITIAAVVWAIGAAIAGVVAVPRAHQSTAAAQNRVTVVAEVVGQKSQGVEVRFRLAESGEFTAVAPINRPSDAPIGNVYPALAESDGSAIRLRMAPYDWRTPVLGWGALPTLALAIWTSGRLLDRRSYPIVEPEPEHLTLPWRTSSPAGLDVASQVGRAHDQLGRQLWVSALAVVVVAAIALARIVIFWPLSVQALDVFLVWLTWQSVAFLTEAIRGRSLIVHSEFRETEVVQSTLRNQMNQRLFWFADSDQPWATRVVGYPAAPVRHVVVGGSGRYRLVAGESPFVVHLSRRQTTRIRWIRLLK